MLRHARRCARAEEIENLALIRGDALRLPCASGRFDVINCCDAFHLFPDADLALARGESRAKAWRRFTVAAFRRGSGRLATLGSTLRRRIGIDSFTPRRSWRHASAPPAWARSRATMRAGNG
jgi:hypothetical protein